MQKKKRTLPRELTEGLKPIRISHLRPDYAEAYMRAMAERDAEIAKKLAALLHWYGIAPLPHCWYKLCLALAGCRRWSGTA